MLSCVAAFGAAEFYTLVSDPTGRPLGWLGIAAAVAVVLLAAVETDFRRWADHAFVVLLFLGLLSLAVAVFDQRIQRGLLAAAATVAGALYTGGTLAFGVLIRELPESRGISSVQGLALIPL